MGILKNQNGDEKLDSCPIYHAFCHCSFWEGGENDDLILVPHGAANYIIRMVVDPFNLGHDDFNVIF